jgi:monoterpene epsilon-lactone hydrolase
MASPQAEQMKAALRATRANAGGTAPPSIQQTREMANPMMAAMAAVPVGVRFEAVDAGGVPAIWVVPEGATTDRVIQYLHGGGYVIGTAATHQNMLGHLANATGCRALSVDYRLAPEHPHPAAVNDSVTAYEWLLAQGIDARRIAVAGDSAGGGLTMATLIAIRDRGLPNPAAGIPMSPWIDMEVTGSSMQTKADVDLMVGAAGLKMMADLFLNGHDARDPLCAPLHADLTGIAPIYVQVGGEETLLDDATRLATNAAAAGVDVRLDVFPEMQHVFQLSVGNMPEADDAIERIASWLRPRLGLTGRTHSAQTGAA